MASRLVPDRLIHSGVSIKYTQKQSDQTAKLKRNFCLCPWLDRARRRQLK